MTARDLCAPSDDTLIGRLNAGLSQAPESELLAAAAALTRIHPTPAHLAALAARPVEYTTTRFACPFCRRYSRSKREPVADHMTRCWKNPAVRACKTCHHFCQQDTEPEVGLAAVEWCDAQDVGLDGIRDHCPLWAPQSAS